MLKRVTITGLGPHENFTADLNPRGTTVISGPSESGKTTILEAVQFALWGRTSRGRFPVEQIRDGHDQALVELVLDSGRVIRRTVRRSKSQTRNIAYGSMKQSFSSEKAFQEQLGELGEDAEALRLVLVPLAWTELVGGNARAFRDVLSRVLPPGDISAEVKTRMMERGFQATAEEAQATEKEVMAWRRDAKAELNQWKGRVATLEERAAELEASAEEEQANTELEQANYVLNRAALWDAHAKAVRGAGARLLAEKTLKAWEKRHKELGEAPTYDEGSLESARLEEKHARQELKTLMESATGTKAAHDLAVKALEEMEDSGDTCPTCLRGGWEAAATAVQHQENQLAELKRKLGAVIASGKNGRARHNAAREAIEQAQEAKSAWEAWQAAEKALGTKPDVPKGSKGEPPAPEVECPTEEEVGRASTIADAAKSAQGAREQRAKDLTDARRGIEEAQQKQAQQDAVVDRFGVLLDAVREAPSVVVARQAQALGNMGPVSLRFGDNPAVEVLIDERPWWLASRGRQVVGDVWLRSGLRHAMDVEWLGIIVDNIQDVGGQNIPEVAGPVVLLQTTHSDELKVVRKR